MRADVEFPGAHGTTLRGWLHVPDGTGPFPAVVLAHGFSATREMGLDRWAAALERVGFAALVYDHRNLGASDGTPRQLINPWAQARDYRYALDWVSARPEVDPDRLAVWGSSYSGGQAIVVGAVDERVRAVVANVPFAASRADYGDTTEAFEAIRAALLDESGAGPADTDDAPAGPLAVVAEEGVDLPVFLDQPESAEWFLAEGRRPGSTWENRVLLQSAAGDPAFDPGACIDHVSPTPLLLIVATEDRLAATELALAAFERAGEPKRLELVEGHHFMPYGGPAFARASQATVDFLREWL
jgi:uncharacterized protein